MAQANNGMAEDSFDVAKSTNTSTLTTTYELGRRLVEYFVVVSTIERKEKNIDKNNSNDLSFSDWKTVSPENRDLESVPFRPTVTSRYPLYDHADNPLAENLTFFCHPSGSIHLQQEEPLPKVSVYGVFWVRKVCL